MNQPPQYPQGHRGAPRPPHGQVQQPYPTYPPPYPYPPQQPYPVQQAPPGTYAYGRPVAPDNGASTAVFVLGLLGLFVAITAPIAWLMGNAEKRRLEQAGFAEPGLLTAGRVLGLVVTLLCLVVIGLVMVIVLLAGLAAATAV